MWEPLSLRKNFSWTFVGNVIYAATQWGVLVVLARFGTPETVGQFALGLAITAPIIMFSNLQLRGVQATDAKRTHPFSHYLTLRTITTMLALVVIAGVVYMGGYQGATALVILLVGLAKALESMSDVYYGLLQQRERMDRIAQSVMLRGVLALVAVTGLLYATGSLVAAVMGIAAVWAAVLVLFDVPNGLRLLKRDAEIAATQQALSSAPLAKQIAKLALTALPLGFVMLLISLNTNIPRYFIEGHLGTWELGIFAALAYLMIAGNTIVGALGQSASPRLAQYYAAGNTAAFRNLLGKLAAIGATLGGAGVIVAALLGEPLLRLLYGVEYAAFSTLLVWLMVAAALAYVASFMGYGMTAARLFRIQVPVFALVSLTTLISCFFLVPAYGLVGGAWALIVSASIQLIASASVNVWALAKASKVASMPVHMKEVPS
jgi:O-antigen/teichoic acid export membrane protein